jgi:DNA polymerase kappa
MLPRKQQHKAPRLPPSALLLQRNRPFAVGGVGMISTASYAARKFGVRSAMPGFIAMRLCPHLLFVKPDFQKYSAASEKTR